MEPWRTGWHPLNRLFFMKIVTSQEVKVIGVNEITNLIQLVGFPASLCIILLIGFKYIFDKFMAEMSQERESHRQEMETVTTAVNNNTVALTKLSEKLDKN